MKFARSYRKPTPLVKVTARTSGCPWGSAKLGVVASMTVVCDRSIDADGPHFSDG